MRLLPNLRRCVTFRIRTILVLIAVIAVPLGIYVDRQRRERLSELLKYPIRAAAELGNTAEVGRLLDRGAGVNSTTDGRWPWSPLMYASEEGHLDTVRLLVERGADVNQQDLDYSCSITLAAEENHWDIVEFLLENGADPEVRNYAGRNVLDYARTAKRVELTKVLQARVKTSP